MLQYKVFIGLLWLTSNHMFGSTIFAINHPRDFWKFEISEFSKMPFKQFFPNGPLKHAITSANYILMKSV